MNFRDLIAKMDELSEAPTKDTVKGTTNVKHDSYLDAYNSAATDPTSAADMVKQLASTPVKNVPRLADAIDPSTGILYYGSDQGMRGIQPTMHSFKSFQAGGSTATQTLGKLLNAA